MNEQGNPAILPSPSVVLTRSRASYLWLVLLLAVLFVGPYFIPEAYVLHATEVLLFVLLAVSVNLLIGYGGMISMGHAAFFAIGGYTAGLLLSKTGIGWLPSMLIAPVVAAIAAAIIGYFCIRVTHAYFIMLTMAFGQLVYTLVWKWRDYTNGDDGLIGISPPSFLLDALSYYYFTLGIVLICLVLMRWICESPFGAALKAIRDNASRSKSIGINVARFQLVAFIFAGFFAGIAGALYVFHNRAIFPLSAHWSTSTEIMLMAVVGGANYFAGPILGAVLIKTLGFVLPRMTEYWLFLLGSIVLIISFLMPQGLIAGYQHLRARRKAENSL